MKKFSILTFFVLAAVVSAHAQVGLGIKGGLNFANIDIENADYDSRTGYHFGAFAEIGLGGLALQPELLFSAKGADDLDLSYLEVPILLKKNFAKVLNVHLGPQFGFLTKAEMNDQDHKDFMKSTDVSAVVGAGVNLPLGLVGGARYVYGLSNVWDAQDGSDIEAKNRTLQIYVGWKFSGN